jgi:hypothetical protein
LVGAAVALRWALPEAAAPMPKEVAHWCTILVSVIFFEGFLVHHPVCR